MVLGPNSREAFEDRQTYVIELVMPGSGEVKQYEAETTWCECRSTVNQLIEMGVKTIRMGVVEGDDVRELMRRKEDGGESKEASSAE